MVIISHLVTLAQPLLCEEREDEFSIHRPAMQVKIVSVSIRKLACKLLVHFLRNRAKNPEECSVCGKFKFESQL